jgi:methionyl aminopeptidase
MTPAPDERVIDAYMHVEPAADAGEAEIDQNEDHDSAAEDEPADSSAGTKKKKKKKKKKKSASSTGADGTVAAAAGAKASGPFVPASFGSKPCPSRLITGFTDSYVQYGQTEPPTIPVAELPAFRNGNFPVSYMSMCHA